MRFYPFGVSEFFSFTPVVRVHVFEDESAEYFCENFVGVGESGEGFEGSGYFCCRCAGEEFFFKYVMEMEIELIEASECWSEGFVGEVEVTADEAESVRKFGGVIRIE